MCKDLGSQQKSPSQFNRLFFLWQSLVHVKQKPYTYCGCITLLHTGGGDNTCVCYWKEQCLSSNQEWGKSLKNQQQREHSRAAVAESSRLRPSLRLRWFLACPVCFSDIASDLQHPTVKTFLLGGTWEWEQRKRFPSVAYTHKGNSKQRSPNPVIS